MIKLVATVAVIATAAVALVNGINAYLGVDDLKDCARPDFLNTACAPADVIIAISGGDTQARTKEAIALYKAGWAPKLLFSGAALDTSGPSNAEAMRAQAIKAGVPKGDIILDTLAQDTAQNATASSALLTTRDKRVIVVTSPYHQRRASLEFKHALGDTVTVISHPTPDDSRWGNYWWTTFGGWVVAISETVKTLVVSTWH